VIASTTTFCLNDFFLSYTIYNEIVFKCFYHPL
jgi:hypothetical protein